ncbi:MAG: DUF4405 domain-containing protein [Syntrophotaleaceae bacterium]
MRRFIGYLKYFVDLFLLMDLLAVAATGFLLGVVIPVGRAPYPAKYFLGLHRHTWGDIHLALALFFLLLVLFHLSLNWGWLLASSVRYFHHDCYKAIWALFAAALLIFLIGWLAVYI